MGIGAEIAKRRSALGKSQGELAAAVGDGCAQQTIARIEAGATTTSKYLPKIIAALERMEGVPPSNATKVEALGPDQVQAVLEVLFHTLCNSDKAAEWAAQAVVQELLKPQALPYGLDRQAFLRAETGRILRELSELGPLPNGSSKKS